MQNRTYKYLLDREKRLFDQVIDFLHPVQKASLLSKGKQFTPDEYSPTQRQETGKRYKEEYIKLFENEAKKIFEWTDIPQTLPLDVTRVIDWKVKSPVKTAKMFDMKIPDSFLDRELFPKDPTRKVIELQAYPNGNTLTAFIGEQSYTFRQVLQYIYDMYTGEIYGDRVDKNDKLYEIYNVDFGPLKYSVYIY